jgi:tetratricopeptide (TPR) repeat protein
MGSEINSNQQYENTVFISYKWEDASIRVVDELVPVLKKEGIPFLLDRDDVQYKESFKAFEQRIGRGQCIVLIISDNYLKSTHCMRELKEIKVNHNFTDRVFPIILNDALIYTTEGRLKYIKYWDDKIQQLDAEINTLDRHSNLQSIFDDIEEYKLIRFYLVDMINYLADIKTGTLEIHEAENFSTLVGLIEPIIKGDIPLSTKDLMIRNVIPLSQGNPSTIPPLKRIFIKLTGNLREYNVSRLRNIQRVLSNALGIVEDWIQILGVKPGSVIAIIELPESAIVNLVFQIINADPRIFDHLKVKELSIEGVDGVIAPRKQTGSTKLFVGHEDAMREFRNMLSRPYGSKHILFMLGSGGAGKTTLVRRMLAEVRTNNKAICANEPIDLFSTDYRHIDGLQWRIKEIIENLPELVGKPSPFASWIKGETDTNENFHDCLQAFCAKHPLVLAFDTFENLDTVASNWLFNAERGGLQVPGLICIIAGREEGREKEELDTYQMTPLVKAIKISGLSLEQAQEFYQRIENEYSNPLDADLKVLGVRSSEPSHKGIERIWKIAQGNPLKLEMAFRWSGDILFTNSFAELSPEQYEEKLMRQVFEWGQQDKFAVSSLSAARPVFDTLLCLAHITRRFDMQFLDFLIEEKFVNFGDSKASKEEVLAYLKQYFFVKMRDEGLSESEVIQLHDEMARLVRKYIWPDLDKSGERRISLFSAVIRFYDGLIAQASGNLQDTLQVEQLYYTLQQDRAKSGKRSWSETGLQRWFELAELGSENIKKLLPGEIKRYIKEYDTTTQVKIHSKLAEIERNANHIKQAMGHWEEVKKLGSQNEIWVVDAFVGQFNCICKERPEEALSNYLEPALKICEKKYPERLALIYYEKGFAYRQMQKLEKAVEWYKKALDKFRDNPDDSPLEGTLHNDVGYVYLQWGRWGDAIKNLNEALDILKARLQEAKKRLDSSTPKDKLRLESEYSQSNLFVGLSYNTLGEFHRFADDLEEALKNYNEAYTIFDRFGDYYWQAKSLCARGETHRRLALQEWQSQKNSPVFQEHFNKAFEDIEKSLYLCEKYQLIDEIDTGYRRLGRLLHDRAMTLNIETPGSFKKDLEDAYENLQQGLRYAKETGDVLEELENLTELAFLADDAISVLGEDEAPRYKEAVRKLEQALKDHKNDRSRIYVYPVFEALLAMEQAALDLADKKYSKALDGYVKAFKGLGTFPGYGHARYKLHFHHLTSQILRLDKEEQAKWCRRFIKEWKETKMPGRVNRTLADDLLPDLVKWCNRTLKKSE